MNSPLFAAIEGGLAVAVVFGLAAWQLISVRRSLRRDRKNTETAEPPP